MDDLDGQVLDFLKEKGPHMIIDVAWSMRGKETKSWGEVNASMRRLERQGLVTFHKGKYEVK